MKIRSYRAEDAAVLAAVGRTLGRRETAVSLHRELANTPKMGGRVWVAALDGQPIGYATVLPLPGLPHLLELDGFIAPSQQRRGYGSALLTALLAALAGSHKTLTYAVNSHDKPAALFLRHHQFAIEHEEWQMVWRAEESRVGKTAVLPPHLTIRTLPQPQAIAQFVALYDRSFGPHPWYQPYTPDEVAALLASPADLHFLYAGKEPIGFTWLRLAGGAAEIEPVGIVPAWQGRGNGRFLLHHTLAWLARHGYQEVHLGVWQSNQAAVQLYQRLGFCHSSSRYFYGRLA
ncbi:MAG: GNAT family N-acetyltransferase [Chloroflexota bacterium]